MKITSVWWQIGFCDWLVQRKSDRFDETSVMTLYIVQCTRRVRSIRSQNCFLNLFIHGKYYASSLKKHSKQRNTLQRKRIVPWLIDSTTVWFFLIWAFHRTLPGEYCKGSSQTHLHTYVYACIHIRHFQLGFVNRLYLILAFYTRFDEMFNLFIKIQTICACDYSLRFSFYIFLHF